MTNTNTITNIASALYAWETMGGNHPTKELQALSNADRLRVFALVSETRSQIKAANKRKEYRAAVRELRDKKTERYVR